MKAKLEGKGMGSSRRAPAAEWWHERQAPRVVAARMRSPMEQLCDKADYLLKSLRARYGH